MRRFQCAILLFYFSIAGYPGIYAQEEAVMDQEVTQAAETAPDTRLVPVFPEETRGLVFLEGEDAVSTNFASDPVYNYGCSGLRTLQLSRSTGLQGGAPFYAQYVFFIEEDGVYSFGYGGTPPGPADDIYPSYVSPFSYSVDEEPEQPVYRDDVAVTGRYTPAYYWVHIGDLELTKGIHTVTFRVSEKRGYDGIYFFYLDNFFFIHAARQKEILSNPGRTVFPTDYTDRSMDKPFLSFADYTKALQAVPEDPEPYLELSLVYSLVGDYLSSLKTLQKVLVLNPEDPYPLLLTAKNRIWKGDIAEGIAAYREVLKRDPDNPVFWAEAAKVAAWTNLHRDALELYEEALQRFPDDINLTVNLALTYLWMSKNEDAEKYFRKARATAESDPYLFAELGRVFTRSGYLEKAVETYEAAIEAFPEHLELYLLLESAFEGLGRQDEALRLHGRIPEIFQPSVELTAYLELFREKTGMKKALLDDYRGQVVQDPANLDLRSFLVQTYFWNGMRQEAVDELLNILAGYAYRNFVTLDERSFSLYQTLESLPGYSQWLTLAAARGKELKSALQESLSIYRTAEKAALKEAASEAPVGNAARDLFRGEEEKMTALLEETHVFLKIWEAGLEAFFSDADLTDFIEKEREDKRTFELLTKNIRWKWDRKFYMTELQKTFLREPVLAGYVLARLYYFEENYTASEGLLLHQALADSRMAPVLFARYQTGVLNPSGAVDSSDITGDTLLSEYAGYIAELQDMPARLMEDRKSDYLYSDDPAVEAEAFLAQLASIEKELPRLEREIQDKLKVLKRIARERAKRSFYQLEEQTYLLRYELGDYYLAMDLPEAAVEQYARVLSIDPWNISAVYKLGTVQQLSGNWARAMESYQRVYWSDPDYAGAIRYYNQLARENADTFSFRSTAFYDVTRINYEGLAEYRRPVNAFLGWDLSYRYRNGRLYRPAGGEDPGNFSVHSLALGVPLTMYVWNLGFRPFAGVGVYNLLYSDDPAFPPGFSRTPEFTLDQFRAELFYGVAGTLKAGPVEVRGLWDYTRKPDTYLPGRTAVFAHGGEVTGTVYIPFPEVAEVNSFSTRTFGRLEFLDDTNLIGTAVQEAVGSFHLADAPRIDLDVIAVLSYEDSWTVGTTDYYSPDSVLVLKGGLRGAFTLPLGKGSLGISAYAAGGGYRSGDDEGMSLQTDGTLDLGYYLGNSALTLSLYGSGTFTRGAFPLTDYWAFQGAVGFSTKLPDLLAE